MNPTFQKNSKVICQDAPYFSKKYQSYSSKVPYLPKNFKVICQDVPYTPKKLQSNLSSGILHPKKFQSNSSVEKKFQRNKFF